MNRCNFLDFLPSGIPSKNLHENQKLKCKNQNDKSKFKKDILHCNFDI